MRLPPNRGTGPRHRVRGLRFPVQQSITVHLPLYTLHCTSRAVRINDVAVVDS